MKIDGTMTIWRDEQNKEFNYPGTMIYISANITREIAPPGEPKGITIDNLHAEDENGCPITLTAEEEHEATDILVKKFKER